jgi:hypothetical protein
MNKCQLDNKPSLSKKMRDKNLVYVWKSIKNNPNLYCWIPVSKKNVISDTLSLKDIYVHDIPPPPKSKNYEEIVNKMSENAQKIKNIKLEHKNETENDKVSVDDPNKYKIVKQFIKDKGLKVYGGAAINMYLPREAKFYNSREIPDYDFFSPTPWKDAVELADIMYKAGYKYTEVRSGIHRGTYKVYSDLWPVADVTYMPPDDFKKMKTITKQGIKLASPAVLDGHMYKQLANPTGNTSRWVKVDKRQTLLSKWTKPLGRKFKCSEDVFRGGTDPGIPSDVSDILEECYKYIKTNKLIYQGPVAYNTLATVGGGTERLVVDHFNVLGENIVEHVNNILQLLITNKNVNKDDLNSETEHLAYKPLNNTNQKIVYKNNVIFSISEITTCVPYKYILGKYICGIDYLKYNLLTTLSFSNDTKESKSLKCQLRYITGLQYEFYKRKKISDVDKSPFQRFIQVCKGPVQNIVKEAVLKRWIDNVERRNKIRIVKPKTETITIKNIKGKRIQISPKSKTSEICNTNKKDDCIYPCNWNDEYNRCFDIPSGIYTAGSKSILPLDENEGGQYTYSTDEKDSYPDHQ